MQQLVHGPYLQVADHLARKRGIPAGQGTDRRAVAAVKAGINIKSAYLAPSAAGSILFLTHIVLAMDLIVMMPLNKFAHVIYRPLALILYQWAQTPAPAADTLDAAPGTT